MEMRKYLILLGHDPINIYRVRWAVRHVARAY
jgi:hypothetical protein